MKRIPHHHLKRLAIGVALLAGALILLLHYGGDLLVAGDPLPSHAQVAVALNGSIAGYIARRAEAMRLLESGAADHVMMSLPAGSYWGENIPEVAQRYFAERYGPSLARKVAYCVNSGDSTIEEAAALRKCLEQEEWRRIIVVTSLYHTRRARMVWRSTFARARPPFQLWIHGVQDADFRPHGWWRNRRYAKTWLFEMDKLAWESIFGAGPWKGPPVRVQLIVPQASIQASSGPGGNP